MKNRIKYVRNKVNNIYARSMTGLGLIMVGHTALAAAAGGVIPVSSDDQTASGSDFAQTMISIFQKDIIPIIEIGAGIWIIWTGISSMAQGIKVAQEKQDFSPLKTAIFKTVTVVVVGGALIWLLDQIRTVTFG